MIASSQRLKIATLLTTMEKEFDNDILNILNGQMMYEQFHTHELIGKSDCAPFNEAMCSHEASDNIFSDEFNKIRAFGHQVSLQEYENKVIFPLKPLFEKQYKCMGLWFGGDLFCQLNLLTLLAYLDQVGYTGKVFFHRVNEMTYEIETTEVQIEGFKAIYQQVLIHHCLPAVQLMPVMLQGIKLYLEYLQEDNEITAYIKKHLDIPQDELLAGLFHQFPQYGLGDTQYLELIRTIKMANS